MALLYLNCHATLMQLATWNVNSLAVRLPQLLEWLAAHPVDALVLQETKLTDDRFPAAEIEAAGYNFNQIVEQAKKFGVTEEEEEA